MVPPGPAAEFLKPMTAPISMLVVLTICDTFFLVSRRVRTFAAYSADSSLGWHGLAVVPIRFAAKVGFWIFGFCTIIMFVTATQFFSFRIVIGAVLAGFTAAYGINYAISRCEHRLYPRGEHGTARPISNS